MTSSTNDQKDNYYFLKFETQKQGIDALVSTGFVKRVIDEEGEERVVSTDPHEFAIDMDIQISKETGNTLTDDEGNEYPETVLVDGYHVNLRLLSEEYREQAESLTEYATTPKTPARVFF